MMIKLTLHPDTLNPIFRTFSEKIIVIGREGQGYDVNLALSDSSIGNELIKIVEENGKWFVWNPLNNPFLELNGFPFGKKMLQPFDRMLIGNTFISFEIIENEGLKILPSPLETAEPLKNEEKFIEEKEKIKKVEEEKKEEIISVIHVAKKEEDQKKDFKLQPQDFIPPSLSSEINSNNIKTEKTKIARDYYLNDFDDESESWAQEKERLPMQKLMTPAKSNWKFWIGISSFAVICSFLVGGIVLFRFNAKDIREEREVVAASADIAMALKYAQIHHITPKKLNWSDSSFLISNISRILPKDLSPLIHLDLQGSFLDFPYILRVYTSSDLSRFIVIAQPTSNLFQWLMDKTAIVVDSEKMVLRKVFDLKSLNRLLANPDPLNGSNAIEISNFLKQSEFIPLNVLISQGSAWEFSPPKALALLKPGAENLIYNAPRYYLFCESLLERAVQLFENPDDMEEVALLQQELKEISHIPDLVIYTSKGMQIASQAQKALSQFLPQNPFHVAYLHFYSDGMNPTSHLLLEEDRLAEPKKEIATPNINKETLLESMKNEIAKAEFVWPDLEENDDTFFESEPTKLKIDFPSEHPIEHQLRELNQKRLNILKPIYDELNSLLNSHLNQKVEWFNDAFNLLVNEFQQTDKEQDGRIVEGIIQNYKKFGDLTFKEFYEFLEKAGLQGYIQGMIEDVDPLQVLLEEDFHKQLSKINASQNLEELLRHTLELNQVLTLFFVPSKEKLISYQDRMTKSVFEKLNDLLESISHQEEQKGVLLDILNLSWIKNPNEIVILTNKFNHSLIKS